MYLIIMSISQNKMLIVATGQYQFSTAVPANRIHTTIVNF